VRAVDSGYRDYLKEIKAGFYDANEVIIDSKLASLTGLALPPPPNLAWERPVSP
jgi:hypothetical protein